MRGKFEKISRAVPNGMDAILLTSAVNTYYATGFEYDDGYAIVTRDETYLLCDFRYIEAAQSSEGTVKLELGSGVLSDTVERLNIKTLGYEDEELTVSALEGLKSAMPKVEFLPTGSLLSELRAVKDTDELEFTEQAQQITDAGFAHIVQYIADNKCNITETQTALELEFFMRKQGSQGVAFQTICVSGPSSSMPHGVPSDVKLRNGFLTMDFGARINGYCSDMTRTVVIGKADEEMKKLYNTVLKAQLSALDRLRAGMTGAEADKIARDIIDTDYAGTFGHSLGHGVGLYIHERPNLSSRATEKTLVPGNIVTVEPGIYISGKYGCRIEDMVAITENGIRNFTKSPKELIEIY